MRAYEKKKLFRLGCKQQVKAGMVNTAAGGWTANTNKNGMERDQKGGHRV